MAVADRQFHATQLRQLTGLEVGEGQARVLLGDLRAYQAHCAARPPRRDCPTAAQLWLMELVGRHAARA